MGRLEKYRLIREALARYEGARQSKRVYHVTEVAGGSRGGGSSAFLGRQVHSELWSLDPDQILSLYILSLPFPLAWRFRFGWLVGVPDLVTFREATPIEVIEVKSYSEVGNAEVRQVSLYGLLVLLNFHTRPRVYVKTLRDKVEVKEWEGVAVDALIRFAVRLHWRKAGARAPNR
jgi:hypothetical protein